MGMVVTAALFGIIILLLISHGIYLMLERNKKRSGEEEHTPDRGEEE